MNEKKNTLEALDFLESITTSVSKGCDWWRVYKKIKKFIESVNTVDLSKAKEMLINSIELIQCDINSSDQRSVAKNNVSLLVPDTIHTHFDMLCYNENESIRKKLKKEVAAHCETKKKLEEYEKTETYTIEKAEDMAITLWRSKPQSTINHIDAEKCFEVVWPYGTDSKTNRKRFKYS